MKWTEILAGDLHAAEQRLRVAFGDKADSIVQKINSNPRFIGRIINEILSPRKVTGESTKNLNLQWLLARKIMRENFFGVEEAIRCFEINPSHEQLAVLSEIPFSETVLQEVRETHILVALFPLSILGIRNKVDKKLFYSRKDSWYDDQRFTKEKCKAEWKLIQKTPVPNSTSKIWQEQQTLLNENEETPDAQSMVYTVIGHHKNTRERLFKNIYVRTSSLDSDGDHVGIGGFGSGGLDVDDWWGSDRYGNLAVASSRKS